MVEIFNVASGKTYFNSWGTSNFLPWEAVQSLSRVQLFATPWTAARQVPLSFTISQSLLKFMSIELVMPCNHLILCHPLLLLPSIFSQYQGIFKWVSSSHQVAKVLELASASVLSMTIWDWFPLGLTGSISLQSKGLSITLINSYLHEWFWLLLTLMIF